MSEELDKPLFFDGKWWAISKNRMEFYTDEELSPGTWYGRTMQIWGAYPLIYCSSIFDPEKY
jgi:hypothetical protein